MANRRRRRSPRGTPANIPNLKQLEQQFSKLQSVLTSPEYMGFIQQGNLRGIREKLLKINFSTIRNVVDRIPLINAIINTRIDQCLPFCSYTEDKNTAGFTLEKIDDAGMLIEETEEDKTVKSQLIKFITQTGLHYDPDREDDFMDYVSMLIRDTYIIDQIATEIQYNKKGEAIAYWILDGAYIKRVDRNSKQFPDDVYFVQEIDNKIYNVYTQKDLFFDYKNKRADLRFRGWGYSHVEQCIDLITTLLFGYNYLRDQLLRDRVPKGFISVLGDIGKSQMDAIQRYWYAAMSGSGGQWNIPILPSGKDGVGLDFKTLAHSNRDMEYHKLMMFLASTIGAVFVIDLAEMGIKTDDSTAIIGESGKPRIQSSKDRGVTSMLMFVQQHLNKILRVVTTSWRFKFTGINPEDETQKANLRKTSVETSKTINEIRAEDGDKEIDADWANVVLSPQAVQIYLAEKQQQAIGGLGNSGNNENQGNEEEPFQELESEDSLEKIDGLENLTKSKKQKEKILRIIIE